MLDFTVCMVVGGLILSLKTVKSLSQKLTTLMDREKLVSVILKAIMESFRLDKAGILLRKGTSNSYRSEKLLGFKAKDLSLTKGSFFGSSLKENQIFRNQ